jgi:hypothetical protein
MHLCQCSQSASRAFDTEELAELHQVARDTNARLGLTGMLLHAEGSFFQVLEGQADVVDALYAKIECDQRHAQVTLIIRLGSRFPSAASTPGRCGPTRCHAKSWPGSQASTISSGRVAQRSVSTPAAQGSCWRLSAKGSGERSSPALAERRQHDMDMRSPPGIACGNPRGDGIACVLCGGWPQRRVRHPAIGAEWWFR